MKKSRAFEYQKTSIDVFGFFENGWCVFDRNVLMCLCFIFTCMYKLSIYFTIWFDSHQILFLSYSYFLNICFMCLQLFCSFQNIARENRELQSELEELRLREDALENAKKELQLQLSRGERDVQYWQSRAEEYSNMVRDKQWICGRGRVRDCMVYNKQCINSSCFCVIGICSCLFR